MITTSIQSVRRLAVTRQHLAGPLPRRVTPDAIVDLVRELAYVQWDPVPIVAPSHLLSIWARLGTFPPELIERLLWEDKRLFEHWIPQACLVLTEDYPLYASLMRRYPESLSHSWANHRTRAKKFLAAHRTLRNQLLREVRAGPLTLGEFADHRSTRRDDGDWNPTSDVATLVFHLAMSGDLMVVGRKGTQNRWGLSKEFLPQWVDRRSWTEEKFEREAARRALHALGTATPKEITYYFPRGRYETLERTLHRLEAEGLVARVVIEDLPGREERYVLTEDAPALGPTGEGPWHPRMSLIPPFDNLIASTARTDRLFGFHYVREQFLAPEKRRFGTYVLPILRGERLIGRIDPRFDRATGTLVINAVHAERDAPLERATGAELAETIASLARFVGASRVRYTARVPPPWRAALAGNATAP